MERISAAFANNCVTCGNGPLIHRFENLTDRIGLELVAAHSL
jgi:hypothetical protein